MTGKIYSNCLILLFLTVFATGCKQNSPGIQLIKDHLNKKINLSGYDFVYSGGRVYSYAEFRKLYPFVTVNYVDEDCAVCKVKIREWCDNFEKVPVNENLAHLFVFRGKHHETFIRYSQGDTAFPYFIMPSEEFTYVQNNSKIDRQIIDAGFLLDKNDRIQLIGDPFISEKMTDLYYQVVRKKINRR